MTISALHFSFHTSKKKNLIFFVCAFCRTLANINFIMTMVKEEKKNKKGDSFCKSISVSLTIRLWVNWRVMFCLSVYSLTLFSYLLTFFFFSLTGVKNHRNVNVSKESSNNNKQKKGKNVNELMMM